MAEREQIYTHTDDTPTLYINSVQLAQSQFDLRLRMGIIEEAAPEKIVTRVSATVFMTMQHAKVLTALLVNHIAKYESINGPLALPTLPEDTGERDAVKT